MKNPFRIGERIYLRPVEVDDVPPLLRWINDPEVNQFLGAYLPFNAVREKEWVEGLYKEPGNVVVLIVVREGDRPIGSCGLHQGKIDLPNRCAELGIAIGDKEFQGRGYGADAIRLLCEYGFNRLGLHRIWLRVYDYNRRGIRCYEKVGFRPEGALREARFLDGRWHDVVVYGLLEHEFRGGNGAPLAARCQEAQA